MKRSFAILFALCALSAQAKFYPSAATGPAGDSTGERTRGEIAVAIAAADSLLATLGSEDVSAWPESWRRIYGTAGAADALAAVNEVRSAFVELRDNWDMLSVQTVTFKKGWNSFYVYVDDPSPAAAAVNPSGYAARLRSRVAANFADANAEGVAELLGKVAALAQAFADVRGAIVRSYSSSVVADWPMSDVYAYMGFGDAAAQFTTDVSAEASAWNPFLSWSAAAPDSVNLASLPAGRVYVGFSTQSVSRTVALLGKSARAGAASWHKTGGGDNPAEWNWLGVTLAVTRMSAANLLTALDFTCSSQAKMSGTDPTQPTFSVAGAGSALSVADGETLIASASAASTWNPAPTANPADGVTIASGKTTATFQLKNDTASPQTVTGTIYRTGILATALKDVAGVEIRATAARGWEKWNFSDTSTTNVVFTDMLAAGETRTYEIRFDRTAFDVSARAAEYSGEFRRTFSAVMRFRYGGSGACSYLSLVGAPDNDAITSTWPIGLWVGRLSFDKVSFVKGNQTIIHNVPAGGTMNVRAIVHVDSRGAARLLHHVVVQTVAATNAVDGSFSQTSLFAADAKPTDSSGTVQRIDSIAMDVDNPVVDGAGKFGGALSFAWTMAPDSRGNPFRHPYHPEHDGLQWDFETPAPNGDDMNNYRLGQVKPETWSIANSLKLSFDEIDAYERPETVTGTCTWELGNVRRTVNGENVRAVGTMSLTRIYSVGKLEQ